MKKNKTAMCAAAALGLMLALPAGTRAASDYTFRGTEESGYYQATNYEDAYGAQFKYGYGVKNVPDYQYSELIYGVYSNTSIGIMDRAGTPGQMLSFGGMGIDTGGIPAAVAEVTGVAQTTEAQEIALPSAPVSSVTLRPKTACTSVSGMARSDGSIGTLSIPSLGIHMKVWEGESTESMAKGVAHYSSTSGWDGNVGLCGHNRGTKYAIGAIKDLNVGDTITYETVYGTRTYAVNSVDVISNTDWNSLYRSALQWSGYP